MAQSSLLFIFGLCYALAAFVLYLSFLVGTIFITLMYILVFPAFRMLLIQFTVFPLIKKHMIDPYYKDHPDEDKEAKRALNIYDQEDEDDDGERVFEDTLPDEDDEPKTTFPRQYSEDEMKRLRRKQRRSRSDDEDDDGTI